MEGAVLLRKLCAQCIIQEYKLLVSSGERKLAAATL
ncbi:hypothetical protein SLEP1_g49479 [Rubroshorea leprosula]|uniref:Uncharacterized protein n=1 Tax=Rubroshorea leprosula TaxID=152421 RepID=A0AAV5LWX6_9ROSI|nr:hypothetical protein SLEP1_g49479 [Rubroshorea leprosula]